MVRAVILVAIGGALGSVLRYLASVFFGRFFSTLFPWATFVVNVLGSLLIGLLLGYFVRNELLYNDLRFLLVVGFCGGFTTFSAFSVESLGLLEKGHVALALGYLVASVLVGLAAVWIGLKVMRL